MLDILIYVAVLVIVVGLVFWLLQQIPLPQPLGKFVQIAVVVIVAIVLIMLLLQLSPSGPSLRLR